VREKKTGKLYAMKGAPVHIEILSFHQFIAFSALQEGDDSTEKGQAGTDRTGDPGYR
jgi:hypothetical protein